MNTTAHHRMPTDRAGTAVTGVTPRWRVINITPVERVGRIVIGAAAVIAAIVLLVGATSVVAVVLEVLLLAAGADLVITGVLGHCPLYQMLGYTPRSLRGTR